MEGDHGKILPPHERYRQDCPWQLISQVRAVKLPFGLMVGAETAAVIMQNFATSTFSLHGGDL